MTEQVHVIIIPGLGNEIQKQVTPFVEHVLTIALNMTLFSGRIIKFLRG